MLKISSNAFVSNFNPRQENHGDELVKAFDLAVEFETDNSLVDLLAPPAHAKDKSLSGALWDQHGHNLLPEVYPIKICKKIENNHVVINEMDIGMCDLKAITITPEADAKIHVKCQIQGQPHTKADADKLWSLVGQRVPITIEQNQADL